MLTAAAFAVGTAYAVGAARRYVDQTVATPAGPLRVVLANRPPWMTDFLADQIAAAVPHAGGRSALDRKAVDDAVTALRADPWVRVVKQVRRTFGARPGDTLEVDCDYRVPVALVKAGGDYWLVDGEAVKMPDPFAAEQLPLVQRTRDGRPNLRVIAGVRGPPPAAGKPWRGDDLAAGLELVRLFHGLPYLDEVSAVDVSNFGGRVHPGDAQVVLDTVRGTQIWWGLPVVAKGFFVEVPVSRKLDVLRATVDRYGRPDAGRAWIDVRFDAPLTAADDVAPSGNK